MPTSSSPHMMIDQLKSVQLNATAKLNLTACIALNLIESLQSVTCTKGTLKMTFDTAANSAYTYQQWIQRKVQFVNGGKEWNCTNSTTGEVILIMMKLIPNTFTLKGNQITVKTTNDTGITPLVCFDKIVMKMTTEQESTKETSSTTSSATMATQTTTTTSVTSPTVTMSVMTKALLPINMTSTIKTKSNETIRGFCFGIPDSTNVYFIEQPSTGQIYQPGNPIRIEWVAKNFDSTANQNFIIKLKRYRPIIYDETIYSLRSCTNPSLGFCFDYLISVVEPSTADFYYYFEWCDWWPYSCSQTGNRFKIPAHVTGGWNYNTQLARANSPITIFRIDCNSNPTNFVARLCNENRQMTIDLTCTNCYLKYDYSILNLDLIASGGVLGTMNIKFKSATTVNLELLLTSNYVYEKSGTISSMKINLFGFGFSILGYSFESGCFLDVDLPYSIRLDALGRISTGLQYVLNTHFTFKVNSGTPSHELSMTLDKQYYPVQASFKANLTVEIGLKPTLRMSAVIISFSITTEGFLRLENQFQFPPFPSIASNIYDYNIDKPSLNHYSYPSDACSTQHLLRYHIQFGIRNSLLTFDVNIRFLTNFISIPIQTHYQEIFLDSNVAELVSGCFFKVPNNDYSQSAHLYLDIPFDSSSSFSDYFKTSIIFEMAKVLNIDQTRILYNEAQAYYAQNVRKYVTLVRVSLLPSILSNISDPTVRSLADTLLAQELNSSSILYTGTQWLKFLMKNLTQQSNIINGIVTTTTTTTTTIKTSTTQ
ncbi:unnamed protein product, partial [Rotaria sordida]